MRRGERSGVRLGERSGAVRLTGAERGEAAGQRGGGRPEEAWG